MLSLFLSTSLYLLFFFTFGALSSKIFKHKLNIFDQLFLGLVASNTLVSLLSIFFPIDIKILVCFLSFCLVITFFLKDKIKEVKRKITVNKKIIILSAPFIFIAFLISLGPQINYDSGLYHIQAIKWIQEYAAIPGLANLHSRFGFNPNLFSVNALASLSFLFKQEIYSLNFTVYTILIVYFLKRLLSIFKEYGISNFFIIYFFIFYELLKLYPSLASPTPDFLAISLTYYIFSRVIDLGLLKTLKNFEFIIPIGIFTIYLITVKLSTIPLLSLLIFLPFFYKPGLKIAIQTILLFSVVVIPWFARNIILTGFLIFPVGFIDIFNFEWQVPLSKIALLENQIKGWARMPGPEHISFAKMEIEEWFPLWWERLNISKKIVFVGGLFLPPLVLLSKAMNLKKINKEFYAVVLTSFIGVIFWFFTAPDFRFGEAFVVTALLSPILFLPFSFKLAVKKQFSFVVLVLLLLTQFSRITYLNNKDFLLNITSMNVFQQKQEPEHLEFNIYNLDGLKIFVPYNDERCFDHALPCADPYNNLDLIEIRNGSLKNGFKPIYDF